MCLCTVRQSSKRARAGEVERARDREREGGRERPCGQSSERAFALISSRSSCAARASETSAQSITRTIVIYTHAHHRFCLRAVGGQAGAGHGHEGRGTPGSANTEKSSFRAPKRAPCGVRQCRQDRACKVHRPGGAGSSPESVGRKGGPGHSGSFRKLPEKFPEVSGSFRKHASVRGPGESRPSAARLRAAVMHGHFA